MSARARLFALLVLVVSALTAAYAVTWPAEASGCNQTSCAYVGAQTTNTSSELYGDSQRQISASQPLSIAAYASGCTGDAITFNLSISGPSPRFLSQTIPGPSGSARFVIAGLSPGKYTFSVTANGLPAHIQYPTFNVVP